MEGSIISSIFFVISFGLLYAQVHRIKKSEKKLNGIVWGMMNFITVLCWGTVCAGIINMVGIPVNIVSIGLIYFISAGVLFWKIRKDGEVQKYEWKKFDIVYCSVIGIVIFVLLERRITPNLDFVFINSDAAVHLKNSLTILRTGTLDTMYFAPLYNALITEIFLPFIAKVETYKVFLIVDGTMFLFECVFFMAMVREYLSKKIMQFAGIVIAFAYIFGYPFHSYLLSFYYWGIGVLLIQYVLLLMREFLKENLRKNVAIFQLMVGCASVTACYMLFGPISYVAVFICLCVYFQKKHTLISMNTVKVCLQVFLVPCILSVYYCYFMFLKKQNLSLEGVLTLQGGIYSELFINFIWVMPFVIYMFVRSVRKKHLDENMIFFLCFGMMVLLMGILIMLGKASAYYYFKFYYPLWALSFIITAQAVAVLYEESKDVLIALVVVIVLVAGVNYTHLEGKAQAKGLGLGDRTSILFDIYYNNQANYICRIVPCNEEYLEACNYVMDHMGKDENVPMVATIENYVLCYWYEALTGEDSSEFYGWHYSIEEMQKKLDNREVNYFTICKKSPVYSQNKKYFDSFQRVYENKEIFVAETKKEE